MLTNAEKALIHDTAAAKAEKLKGMYEPGFGIFPSGLSAVRLGSQQPAAAGSVIVHSRGSIPRIPKKRPREVRGASF